jgi:hypothetical protein
MQYKTTKVNFSGPEFAPAQSGLQEPPKKQGGRGKFALSLFIGLVSLAAQATAAPVFYSITFAGESPLPTSGSFSYDATTQQFSSFLISWTGSTFDLTTSANFPFNFGGCDTPAADSADFFAALTGAACGSREWSGVRSNSQLVFALGVFPNPPSGNSFAVPSGTFSVTSSVPEPSSLAMLLTGAGLAVLGGVRRQKKQLIASRSQ